METKSLITLVIGSILPSLALALLATYIVRVNAARWGLIDQPSERKVHTTPTPRGGGLAVWFGVVSVFALGYLTLWYVNQSDYAENLIPQFARSHVAGIWAQSGKLWTLLAAGTALMLLGLADDLRGLSWQLRLVVELAIAAACVWLVPNLRLTAFLPFP